MSTSSIPPETNMSPLVKAAQKTVAVLGAAYGGYAAAKHLAEQLPKGWRVVVVDRNTHLNHVYVFPRYAVLPGHAHKGFIPYSHIFTPARDESAGHVVLNAHVTKLGPHSATLSKAFPEHGVEGDEPSLKFDYAVYALGSHMPAPIDTWGTSIGGDSDTTSGSAASNVSKVEEAEPSAGTALPAVTTATPNGDANGTLSLDASTKLAGRQWLDRASAYISKVPSVLVVGGGALGIQFATDIADVYPDKRVTLLHSRQRLLPRFDEKMHDEIVKALSALNVNTVLGERLDLSYPGREERNQDGVVEHVVRTMTGRELRASVILLCTGQRPNTDLMQELLPGSIVPEGPSKGMIRVLRTLQVGIPTKKDGDLSDELGKLSLAQATEDVALDAPYPHIFAVGDAADTFGAINAGHTASFQARIAADNIVKLIQAQENPGSSPPQLEEYQASPPGIKMSIGKNKMLYQHGEAVGEVKECSDDLGGPVMWKFLLGHEVTEEELYL